MEVREGILSELKLPKVEYTDNIQNPECPYTLSINPDGAAELLRVAGVKEEDIPRITIKVDRYKGRRPQKSNGLVSLLAEYSAPKKSMTLYADEFWARREMLLTHVPEAIRDGDLSMAAAPFVSRRLESYLEYAPPDRVARTIDRLATIKTNRKLNESLAHESSHAADNSQLGEFTPTDKIRIKHKIKNAITAGIITLGITNQLEVDTPISLVVSSGIALYFLNKSEPMDYSNRDDEVKARAFEKSIGKTVNFASITPK